MRIVSFETFFSLINTVCALAFLVQMSLMVADFLDPSDLNTITYQLNLHQIPFPVKFKLCAIPGFNQSMLTKYGYLVKKYIFQTQCFNFLLRIFPHTFMVKADSTIPSMDGQVIHKIQMNSHLD